MNIKGKLTGCVNLSVSVSFHLLACNDHIKLQIPLAWWGGLCTRKMLHWALGVDQQEPRGGVPRSTCPNVLVLHAATLETEK